MVRAHAQDPDRTAEKTWYGECAETSADIVGKRTSTLGGALWAGDGVKVTAKSIKGQIGIILTLGFGRCAPDRSGWWRKAGRLGGSQGNDSRQHHTLGRRRCCSRSFLLGRKGTCTVFKQSHEALRPQLCMFQPCIFRAWNFCFHQSLTSTDSP